MDFDYGMQKQAPLTDYMVEFLIYLNGEMPYQWSNPVIHQFVFSVASFAGLKKAVNEMFLAFVQQQGVVILKETTDLLADDTKTMDLRCFVPMTSILYITTRTKQIASSVAPVIATDGSQLLQ